jgi:hypothetical protein
MPGANWSFAGSFEEMPESRGQKWGLFRTGRGAFRAVTFSLTAYGLFT